MELELTVIFRGEIFQLRIGEGHPPAVAAWGPEAGAPPPPGAADGRGGQGPAAAEATGSTVLGAAVGGRAASGATWGAAPRATAAAWTAAGEEDQDQVLPQLAHPANGSRTRRQRQQPSVQQLMDPTSRLRRQQAHQQPPPPPPPPQLVDPPAGQRQQVDQQPPPLRGESSVRRGRRQRDRESQPQEENRPRRRGRSEQIPPPEPEPPPEPPPRIGRLWRALWSLLEAREVHVEYRNENQRLDQCCWLHGLPLLLDVLNPDENQRLDQCCWLHGLPLLLDVLNPESELPRQKNRPQWLVEEKGEHVEYRNENQRLDQCGWLLGLILWCTVHILEAEKLQLIETMKTTYLANNFGEMQPVLLEWPREGILPILKPLSENFAPHSIAFCLHMINLKASGLKSQRYMSGGDNVWTCHASEHFLQL